jgi:Ca2+-dependent lipid-binding protein
MFSVCFCLAEPGCLELTNPQGLPDPFAVAMVNGEQTQSTSVIKKTLNPYWNESFDLFVPLSYPPKSTENV